MPRVIDVVSVLADTAAERGEGVLKFLGGLLLVALTGAVFCGVVYVLGRGFGALASVVVDHQVLVFGGIAVGGLVGYVAIGWVAGAVAAVVGFLAFLMVAYD